MPASYQKPNARNPNQHKQEWVTLSAGREGPAPELPDWRQWQASTVEWWSALWAKPQATMWEQDGSTLWAMACLYDDLIANRAKPAPLSAEIRQHEDRHGLNPKAMAQLCWRYEGDEATTSTKRRSKARLKVV